MPNWCSNSIYITGSKKAITEIKKTLESLKDDDGVFEALVGSPDEIESDELGLKTIISQTEYWGTKWDVSVGEQYFEFGEKEISFHPSTAWSPPIEFVKKLSKKFKVDVEIIYSEGGCDFCGKSKIKKGKLISDDCYNYMEGLYHFDNEQFWIDVENDIEFKKENNKEDIIDEYPFLSKKDKKKLSDFIDNV